MENEPEEPEKSHMDDLDVDEILAAADIFVANGNTDKALKMLEAMSEVQPDQALKLYLLKAYHQAGDAGAFETLAERIRPAITELVAYEQIQLQEMYSDLCPDSLPLIDKDNITEPNIAIPPIPSEPDQPEESERLPIGENDLGNAIENDEAEITRELDLNEIKEMLNRVETMDTLDYFALEDDGSNDQINEILASLTDHYNEAEDQMLDDDENEMVYESTQQLNYAEEETMNFAGNEETELKTPDTAPSVDTSEEEDEELFLVSSENNKPDEGTEKLNYTEEETMNFTGAGETDVEQLDPAISLDEGGDEDEELFLDSSEDEDEELFLDSSEDEFVDDGTVQINYAEAEVMKSIGLDEIDFEQPDPVFALDETVDEDEEALSDTLLDLEILEDDVDSKPVDGRILHFPDRRREDENIKEFQSEVMMTLQVIRDQMQQMNERLFVQERESHNLNKAVSELSNPQPEGENKKSIK